VPSAVRSEDRERGRGSSRGAEHPSCHTSLPRSGSRPSGSQRRRAGPPGHERPQPWVTVSGASGARVATYPTLLVAGCP
jgi:hypothetical protein